MWSLSDPCFVTLARICPTMKIMYSIVLAGGDGPFRSLFICITKIILLYKVCPSAGRPSSLLASSEEFICL
jgi:hypothetical protein